MRTATHRFQPRFENVVENGIFARPRSKIWVDPFGFASDLAALQKETPRKPDGSSPRRERKWTRFSYLLINSLAAQTPKIKKYDTAKQVKPVIVNRCSQLFVIPKPESLQSQA